MPLGASDDSGQEQQCCHGTLASSMISSQEQSWNNVMVQGVHAVHQITSAAVLGHAGRQQKGCMHDRLRGISSTRSECRF